MGGLAWRLKMAYLYGNKQVMLGKSFRGEFFDSESPYYHKGTTVEIAYCDDDGAWVLDRVPEREVRYVGPCAKCGRGHIDLPLDVPKVNLCDACLCAWAEAASTVSPATLLSMTPGNKAFSTPGQRGKFTRAFNRALKKWGSNV